MFGRGVSMPFDRSKNVVLSSILGEEFWDLV